jgi:hypothetical protein
MVYYEIADAVERSAQTAQRHARIAEDAAVAVPHREPDGRRHGEVEGWWDEGLYIESFLVIEPQPFVASDGVHVETAGVSLVYQVRHDNLVVEILLDASAPSGDIDAVMGLFHAVAVATVDETVGHLPTSNS